LEYFNKCFEKKVRKKILVPKKFGSFINQEGGRGRGRGRKKFSLEM
jgi:hypothetical protein